MDFTVAIPAFVELRQLLRSWLESRRARSEAEREAISVLLDAVTQTQIYLGDLEMRSAQGEIKPEAERPMERELARAWAKASAAFMGIDKKMAPLLLLKSDAWARPKEWSDQRVREAGITIEDVSRLAQQLLAGD